LARPFFILAGRLGSYFLLGIKKKEAIDALVTGFDPHKGFIILFSVKQTGGAKGRKWA